ncbi:MAG TPA: cupin domain-containing protein [Candidatus Thermoplasmatota archaeon]|nr:cupin domain-containing protein [Candidatus Thermoplasmatota archaeon]
MFHKQTPRLPHKIAVDDTYLAEIIHPIHSKNDPNLPYSLAHAELDPKKKSTPHKLIQSTETYIITHGSGEITIDGKTKSIHAGSVIVVEPNKEQSIQNTGSSTLLFYCIVSPPWEEKDDVSSK